MITVNFLLNNIELTVSDPNYKASSLSLLPKSHSFLMEFYMPLLPSLFHFPLSEESFLFFLLHLLEDWFFLFYSPPRFINTFAVKTPLSYSFLEPQPTRFFGLRFCNL